MSDKKQANEEKETKAQAFSRLASRRTQDAVDSINGIAKCANRNNYDYTPEQAARIVDALRTAVRNLEDAFAGNRRKDVFSV